MRVTTAACNHNTDNKCNNQLTIQTASRRQVNSIFANKYYTVCICERCSLDRHSCCTWTEQNKNNVQYPSKSCHGVFKRLPVSKPVSVGRSISCKRSDSRWQDYGRHWRRHNSQRCRSIPNLHNNYHQHCPAVDVALSKSVFVRACASIQQCEYVTVSVVVLRGTRERLENRHHMSCTEFTVDTHNVKHFWRQRDLGA